MDLGEMAGVSWTTVHRIETRKIFPSEAMMTKIAAALEVDYPDLWAAEVIDDRPLTDEEIRFGQEIARRFTPP